MILCQYPRRTEVVYQAMKSALPGHPYVKSAIDMSRCGDHSNEQPNGLLRRWLPKGTNLDVNPTHVALIQDALNQMPRKLHNWKAAQHFYTTLCCNRRWSLLTQQLERARNHHNTVRLHEHVGYVTPYDENTGQGDQIRQARQHGLQQADAQRRPHHRNQPLTRQTNQRHPPTDAT
ncbi:MAG: hypothetical protein OXB90_01530 [Acidimicrobiaceae bacterium]|nr:hypothetical protein [Acidimicrobiaceae bacterium]